MTVQILYPTSPDIGLLDWQTNAGTVNKYDAINEGTTNPDETDYVLKKVAGDISFNNLYESGVLKDNIKAYRDIVRINLGEMNVFPDSGGIDLNVYAAVDPSTYYGSPAWGIGSFYSESDYLLEYWTLNDSVGLVSKITPGISLSSFISTGAVSFVTGKQGGAASFDGESTFLTGSISTVTNPKYRFSSSKSFGGWIYNNTASGDATIFTLGNGSARNSACTLKLLDGGSMEFAIYTLYTNPETGATSGVKVKGITTTAPAIGQWSFVVCVFDKINRVIKISVNGGAFVSGTFSNYVINEDFGSLYLGGHPEAIYFGDSSSNTIEASYFEGYLDEWAIWDKALTLDQISDIYNSGAGSTYPLDTIIEKKYTTLYDNNGLEIASITPTTIASSGELVPINSSTPTLYTFELNDISEQLLWNEYDLSNTYIDLQLFTERKYTGSIFGSTAFSSASSESNVATGGSLPWSTLDETHTIDNVSTGIAAGVGSTDILYLSSFGFGLPTDATILAVDMQIVSTYVKEALIESITFKMWLTNSVGTIISDEKTVHNPTVNITGATPYISDNVTFTTLGTWGAGLSPSIVNTGGFGVKIQLVTTGSGGPSYTFDIDYVALKIRYSTPGPNVPSIHAAIFTLDVTSDGQQLVSNTVPLYMCNKHVPSETTLYTAALLPSGETPLHIWGHDGIEPTGIPLYTVGGIYENSSTDLYLLNTLTPADKTLYIQGKDSSSGLVPLNMFGKASDSGNTPLFIHGVFSDNSNLPLSIQGFGDEVSSDTSLFLWSTQNPGLRDITSIFMKSDNSGYSDGDMNLYIQSPVSADITSNIPLYINKDTPSLSDTTTLFIQQNNTESSGNTPLFISSPGTTDGAIPYNTDIPLFIARDNNYNWNQTSLYMHVASGVDDTTTMFIKSINNEDNNTTLFVNAKDDTSGDKPLYISGF